MLRLGGTLSSKIKDQGTRVLAWLAVSSDWLETPVGTWQVDWSRLITPTGPLIVDPGGLQQNVGLPQDPAPDGLGLAIHAGLLDSTSVELTNEVVLRILQ